jgi:hypothetical protein
MTYGVEWTPSVAVAGLVALLFVPYLSLIVLGVLLLAAAAAVAALAGAVVSSPYLLGRSVLRRRHARTAVHPANPGQPSPLRREVVTGPLAKRGGRPAVVATTSLGPASDREFATPASSRLCSRTVEARSLGTNELPDPTEGGRRSDGHVRRMARGVRDTEEDLRAVVDSASRGESPRSRSTVQRSTVKSWPAPSTQIVSTGQRASFPVPA